MRTTDKGCAGGQELRDCARGSRRWLMRPVPLGMSVACLIPSDVEDVLHTHGETSQRARGLSRKGDMRMSAKCTELVSHDHPPRKCEKPRWTPAHHKSF